MASLTNLGKVVKASVYEGEAKASAASLHLQRQLLHDDLVQLLGFKQCFPNTIWMILCSSNCSSQIRSGQFMDWWATVWMLGGADLHDSDFAGGE